MSQPFVSPVVNANTVVNCTVDAAHELMVTRLDVVEDGVRTQWTGNVSDGPDGTWTLSRQLARLAGNTDPNTFVRAWLNQLVDDDQILPTQWHAKAAISTSPASHCIFWPS